MKFLPIVFALGLGMPAWAEGERAGDFDYYVLALSWAPGWCATEGKGRDAGQCRAGAGADFVLHGLWPQYEQGWPSYCRTAAEDPSRPQTVAMADIMGSDGAAWYQWKKHGRCAGLAAEAYFAKARDAYESIEIPQAFRGLDRDVKLSAATVEEAFLQANPALTPAGVTVTCKQGRIQEVRLCLSKALAPRGCGEDVRRDCRMSDALMERVK